MIIFIILFSLSSHAGLNIFGNGEAFEYELEPKKEEKSYRPKIRVKKRYRDKRIDQLLRRLEENDKNVAEILENNNKKIIVKKSEHTLNALSRFKGVLLNSTLATNQMATKLIIRLFENEFFEEAELRCLGVSYGKRVKAKCDLLVTPEKQYQIQAELWDLDGAEGLLADEFYSGEEKSFLTSSFASFFEGVLDGARDRIVTPFGETVRTNAKNQVLGGLMGVADNTNKKIKEASEKNIQVALINSGKEVIVFFDKQVGL